jgi:hypothetical protein
MSLAPPDVVERFRQPEYVGENRCVPCTAVNVTIAAVVAAALVVAGQVAADLTVGVVAGAGFLAVGLASIYLRGYLVPGTPTLTKRYFPDRVLRWFDKAPAGVDAPVAGTGGDVEPEPLLLEADAVELCQGGEDLCATEAFAEQWREETAALRDGGDLQGRMAEMLDTDREDVEVATRTEFAMVRNDGQAVARWESMAALLADAGAYPWLAERVDGWDDLSLRDRGQLLNGARVFLQQCPRCDGPVDFSEDTVESCCRSVDVIAMECTDCGSVLLEVEA